MPRSVGAAPVSGQRDAAQAGDGRCGEHSRTLHGRRGVPSRAPAGRRAAAARSRRPPPSSGPAQNARPARGVAPGEREPAQCERRRRGAPRRLRRCRAGRPAPTSATARPRRGERRLATAAVTARAAISTGGQKGRSRPPPAAAIPASAAGTSRVSSATGGATGRDLAGRRFPWGALARLERGTQVGCQRRPPRVGAPAPPRAHDPTAASRRFGRSGLRVASGGAPASIVRATSGSGTPQNGCLPASASQSSTPTAQTSLAGEASSPRSRSGEMYASVPGTSPTAVSVSASSNWASPKSSSRTESAGPSSSSTFAGLTSRWTMPLPWACASPSRTWAATSTASRSLQRACPQRLAERPPVDVLVGDVDVAGVAAEVVGADAARVAQPRGGFHLALGARSALALAGDDLEGDVEAGPLVPRQPDRARAAAAERPQRAVAVEDELSLRQRVGGRRHGSPLRRGAEGSSGRRIPYSERAIALQGAPVNTRGARSL